MSILSLDGYLLKRMFMQGTNKLSSNKDKLNALNVFPVPDGDTGTNMSLTLLYVADSLEKCDSNKCSEVSKIISQGTLRGARGNSGVILSQLFRGFNKGFEGVETAETKDLINAFVRAKEAAYKAVMVPKEGTILTVARCIADRAEELTEENLDIKQLFDELIKTGNETVLKTREMLPVLKQANVVDAGGLGYVLMIEGMRDALEMRGDIIIQQVDDSEFVDDHSQFEMNPEDIVFGYCTEFLINLYEGTKDVEQAGREYLSKLGDSVVVIEDDGIVKVHVHTNNPGSALEQAIRFGALDKVKIENMRAQYTELAKNREKASEVAEEQEVDVAFVAVCTGDGNAKTFEEMGASYVVEGGQSMNPSSEDLLNAVNKVKAKNVIILPNNSNVILAAEQVKHICEDKEVFVVPSKNMPQGINTLINYIPNDDINVVMESLIDSLSTISTGEVTFAVRDAEIDNVSIKEGQYLYMKEGKVSHTADDLLEGTVDLVGDMLDDGEGYISCYYGSDVTEETANELSELITEKYPKSEVTVVYGGQPLYYFIISCE